MAKKESYFWTSYSDLMTSMFFIMLVLFVLAIALSHRHINELNKERDVINKERLATKEQLRIIEEIEKATQTIDPKYFDYNLKYKKHVLKTKVYFPPREYELSCIEKATQEELIRAGKAIQQSINQITAKYPEIQYILVIEGQASKDSYKYNYDLSYNRALTLMTLWKNNNINFGPNCEVVIGGNGDGTLYGTGFMRDREEKNNQRFLIHILPKNSIPKKINFK